MRYPVTSILGGLVVAVLLSTSALADAALELWAQGKYEASHRQNAYDDEMKNRAAKLLSPLKSGDRKILDGTVKDYLGIPS